MDPYQAIQVFLGPGKVVHDEIDLSVVDDPAAHGGQIGRSRIRQRRLRHDGRFGFRLVDRTGFECGRAAEAGAPHRARVHDVLLSHRSAGS